LGLELFAYQDRGVPLYFYQLAKNVFNEFAKPDSTIETMTKVYSAFKSKCSEWERLRDFLERACGIVLNYRTQPEKLRIDKEDTWITEMETECKTAVVNFSNNEKKSLTNLKEELLKIRGKISNDHNAFFALKIQNPSECELLEEVDKLELGMMNGNC
jgi:hypothetical protein